ncbi:MAG: hypothetical protein HEQ19_03375 [Gloeotrichia echinulata CP02]
MTRDCTSGADATRSLLPRSGTAPLSYQGLGIGDWGLGIGLIYSLLITHYSLLITHYSLLLTHYSLLLTIGDWEVNDNLTRFSEYQQAQMVSRL